MQLSGQCLSQSGLSQKKDTPYPLGTHEIGNFFHLRGPHTCHSGHVFPVFLQTYPIVLESDKQNLSSNHSAALGVRISVMEPQPCLGIEEGWGSLVGCRLWSRTESDTTEATQQQQQQCYFTTSFYSYKIIQNFPFGSTGMVFSKCISYIYANSKVTQLYLHNKRGKCEQVRTSTSSARKWEREELINDSSMLIIEFFP